MSTNKHTAESRAEDSLNQLTPADLDNLAKKLDRDLSKRLQPTNSTINLSCFGLRSPDDIKVFLLSPAGNTLKTELSTQLAFEHAIQEERKEEQQEEAIMRQRVKALLFLWLIEEKGNAAWAQRELTELINRKAIKDSGPKNTASQQKTPYEADKELYKALGDYDQAIKSHQEQHAQLRQKEQNLSDKLSALSKQEQGLVKKYHSYHEGLKAIDESVDKDELLSIEALDKKIQSLEEKMHAQTDEVVRLLDNGQEEEARALLAQQNALNLQIASLQDIRSKEQGKKIFVNAQGEVVSSSKDAVFILNKEANNSFPKIVEEHDKYYLLKPGEKWEDVQKNPEAKKEAEANFTASKHELMSVKKAVSHVQKLEMNAHKERIKDTHTEIADNQAAQLVLANQIRLLQASRANAQTLLQNPNNRLTMQPPSPSLTPTLSPSVNKLSDKATPQVYLSAFIQQQLKIWGKNSKPTKNDLLNLVDNIPDPKAKNAAINYLKKQLHLNLGEIPRTAPIPQQAMTSLLQNMARFAADPYKHSITNEQGPQELSTNQKKTSSPFDIKPSPYN